MLGCEKVNAGWHKKVASVMPEIFQHLMAIIFDFDGVLADTEQVQRLAWAEVARRSRGLDPCAILLADTPGMPDREIGRSLLGGNRLVGHGLGALGEMDVVGGEGGHGAVLSQSFGGAKCRPAPYLAGRAQSPIDAMFSARTCAPSARRSRAPGTSPGPAPRSDVRCDAACVATSGLPRECSQ